MVTSDATLVFEVSSNLVSLSEGRAGPAPAAVLQERRRLPPLLQRGPPLLFPQPDH